MAQRTAGPWRGRLALWGNLRQPNYSMLGPNPERNGYLTWTAWGTTCVQLNLPPQRLQTEDLFVVTCEYDPVNEPEP